MSLREWLIAIGTLVIIGIVIDGLRRMHRARKESMAISSGMGADDLAESPLEDDYNPELPNGGARTISPSTLEERGYVRREPGSRFGPPKTKPTRPVIAAREDKQGPEQGSPEDGVSTGWGALDDDPKISEQISGQSGSTGQNPSDDEPEEQPAGEAAETDTFSEAQGSGVEADTAGRGNTPSKAGQPLAGANRPEAREVIVINVLSAEGNQYTGKSLKALFEACGLEFGDMDIYHRHEQADTTSPVQFSVASAVKPGTFRPEEMDTLATPGISFFMSLPGPDNPLQAFDFMLETAQCVVRNLGGELKDERRSVMTPQTSEHCRQRIREFERKQRSPVH